MGFPVIFFRLTWCKVQGNAYHVTAMRIESYLGPELLFQSLFIL